MAADLDSGEAPADRVDALRSLRFRLDLWLRARMLPFWVGRKDFGDVLKLARPRHPGRYNGLSAPTIAAAVVRTTRHPWLMRDRRCLRQGLLGYYFLAEAGHDPELHFGVGRTAGEVDRLTAHCWVEIAGTQVISAPQPDMVTIWVHRDAAGGTGQND